MGEWLRVGGSLLLQLLARAGVHVDRAICDDTRICVRGRTLVGK